MNTIASTLANNMSLVSEIFGLVLICVAIMMVAVEYNLAWHEDRSMRGIFSSFYMVPAAVAAILVLLAYVLVQSLTPETIHTVIQVMK